MDREEKTERMKRLDMIQRMVPVTEVLAGLAEECAELSQAALKLRRVLDGTNPTPVAERRAIIMLHEEIADVLLYMDVLGDMLDLDIVDKISNATERRWAMRLESAETEVNGT